MLIPSIEETRELLPYAPLMAEIDKAAGELRSGAITAPERTSMPLPGDAVLLYMPASDGTTCAAKLLTVHPGNPSSGLPSIHAQILVMDARTGVPGCLLDGPTVTSRRTAAVTLYGARRLGYARPRKVLVVGTGVQAAEHVRAIAEVCAPERIYVAGLNLSMAETFVHSFLGRIPALTAVDHADAVSGEVDLIVTLTTSKAPVISPNIPDSTLVIGVGAFKPDMIEIPAELIWRRKVVVDHLESARLEAGDLLSAGLDWSTVEDYRTLRDRAPQGPAILKTVGHAAWDLAAARMVNNGLARRRAG